MNGRGQAEVFPLSIVFALVIAGVLGVIIFDAVGADGSEIEREYEQAQAYCYQAFGEPTIGHSNVIGNHGGWHCEANENDPHLHDATDEAIHAAYYANQTNQTVDWSEIDRYEPTHKRGYTPTLFGLGSILGLGLLMLVAIKYAPGMAGGRR